MSFHHYILPRASIYPEKILQPMRHLLVAKLQPPDCPPRAEGLTHTISSSWNGLFRPGVFKPTATAAAAPRCLYTRQHAGPRLYLLSGKLYSRPGHLTPAGETAAEGAHRWLLSLDRSDQSCCLHIVHFTLSGCCISFSCYSETILAAIPPNSHFLNCQFPHPILPYGTQAL
jgi:hypothetical protein